MRLEVHRRYLQIIPETAQDEAYIEEVLGLRDDLDLAPCYRRNAHNLGCMGSLVILKEGEKP